MSKDVFGVEGINENFSILDNPSSKKNAQKEAEHFRKGFFNQQQKWHTDRILILSIWSLFVVAIVVFIIRVLHFIIPDVWCWLSNERLQNIDKFLFSGAFGGILVKYATYIFYDKKKEN